MNGLKKVSTISFRLQWSVKKKGAAIFHVMIFHAYIRATSEPFAAMVVQVSDGMFEHQTNQTIKKWEKIHREYIFFGEKPAEV